MGIQQDSRHKRRATGGKRASYRKNRKFSLGRQPALTKLGETRVRQIRVRGGSIKLRALRLDSGIFSWGSEGISRKSRIINVVYNGANNEFVRTNTLVKGVILKIDAAPFRLWYESYYGVTLGKKKTAAKAEVSKSAKAPAKGAAKEAEAPKEAAKGAAKGAAKSTKAPAKGAAKEAPAKEAAKDAPKDAAKAPAKGAKAPAKGVKAPAKGAKAPAKGTKATVRRLSSRRVSGKEVGIKTTKSALTRYRKRAPKRVIDSVFEDQFATGFLLACISSRPGQTGRVDGYLLEGKELEFYQKKTQKKKSQK